MRPLALLATLLALPAYAGARTPPACPSQALQKAELRFLELDALDGRLSGRLVLTDPAGRVERVRVFFRTVDEDGAGSWSSTRAYYTPEDLFRVRAELETPGRDARPEAFAVALDADGEVLGCAGSARAPVRLSRGGQLAHEAHDAHDAHDAHEADLDGRSLAPREDEASLAEERSARQDDEAPRRERRGQRALERKRSPWDEIDGSLARVGARDERRRTR